MAQYSQIRQICYVERIFESASLLRTVLKLHCHLTFLSVAPLSVRCVDVHKTTCILHTLVFDVHNMV